MVDGETIDPENLCFKCSLADLGLEPLLGKCHDWKPDMIYSQGVVSPAFEAALLSLGPAVMYAHGYYGTCGTGLKIHAFPVIQPCKRQMSKMCLLLHLPRRCGGLNPVTAWNYYQTQDQRRKLFPCYRAVLVGSRHMAREFGAHGVPAAKLRLAPLPIPDMTPDSQPPRVRELSGKILFLGRIAENKGVGHLLDALPKAQQMLGAKVSLSLRVAGSGPDEEKFRAVARRANLPVEFVGWAGREERLRLLREADLLAVPSVWPEPFGLVGPEAACVGVPAAGFDVGGISDWLENGRTGELAPGDPPTADGLATAIVRALEDSSHHQRLREGAWKKSQEFTNGRHLDQLEEVFLEAISAAPAAVQK